MQKKLIGIIFVMGLLPGTSISAKEELSQKALSLDALLIEGEIQKPEAYFVLQHKTFDALLNAETEPKFNAIQEIEDAVLSNLFD